MPFSTQFSVSVELAKILPARAALTYGAESIINLVRDLRRSGSDFLVEEDLAAIFSRGRVVSSLETHFRDVVKVALFTPLHAGSEIILDAGPGPTVRRALKDRYYMTTIIQLSCLGFLHETTTLAAALVESMHKRYELGIKGATPDPDYDGILSTLLACKSQTSQYPWEMLVSLVESRFKRSAQWFGANNSPLRRLSADLLMGAVDYLYLVQSLPEDRIMMVENQMGLVPVVVWAHCVLGLTVLVKGSPDGNVVFGRSPNPQVIINWSHNWQFDQESEDMVEPSFPAVYLLDGSMDVVLSIEAENDQALRIEGQQRLRLRGYGTNYLRRLFNKQLIVIDDDPIYEEYVLFVVAIAILMSKVLRRVPLKKYVSGVQVPALCHRITEYWRILTSSELLFSGIAVNKKDIDHYVERLTGVQISEMALPPTCQRHLEKNKDQTRSKENFKTDITRVAFWILSFAQVTDLESCSDMPLRYEPSLEGFQSWDGIKPIEVDSEFWLTMIVHLVVGSTEITMYSRESQRTTFLLSHYGWSMFYNSIGDIDPGRVSCELLSIKRGVPTSTRTNERKYQLADAPRIWPRGMRPPVRIDAGESYLPRCLSPVVKRTEQYSSRGTSFLLTIRYDVDESGTPLRAGEEAKFSVYATYHPFFQGLWDLMKTSPCPHLRSGNVPVKLDVGVTTAKGFNWASADVVNERICINLVKGDARARWLSVAGCFEDDDKPLRQGHDAMFRQVMLRLDDCCEDCAVQSASAMPGKWLVIL